MMMMIMLSNISSFSIITSFLLQWYHIFPVTMVSHLSCYNGITYFLLQCYRLSCCNVITSFLLQWYCLFPVTMLSSLSCYNVITSFLLQCYHLFVATVLPLLLCYLFIIEMGDRMIQTAEMHQLMMFQHYSAVGNVSGYRCVSDCRSRGREFDPGLVPYFRGD